MSRTPKEMMAYALEIDEALLPYVGELLTDLDELGSDAELIVEILQSLKLSSDTRVLDLGCGKGAVAIDIAADLGWRVHGVDLCEPFIADAQQAARDTAVDHLCSFEQGDVVAFSHALSDTPECHYDVVIMAALGDALGSWSETMEILRQCVVPGGLILISDCYLRDGGSADFPGFENYLGRVAMTEQLTSRGDRLLRAVVESDVGEESGLPAEEPVAATWRSDQEVGDELSLIRRRSEAIAARHPELASALKGFVDDQAREGEFLERNMVDVVWVLERGAG